MDKSRNLVVICFVVFVLIVSGCGPRQAFGPTLTPLPTSTPIPTSTKTQVPTSTPMPTYTPKPTATATPAPACNPGTTIQGAINYKIPPDYIDIITNDDKIPGYIDITKVSTNLDGAILTVVFSLRELPDKITINQKDLEAGRGEIAWGVAIDDDNDPDTGGNLREVGKGYSAVLRALHFKNAAGEQTDAIDKLFRDKINVWGFNPDGRSMSPIAKGTISVNVKAKTITLTAKVHNISPTSYLSFFTYYDTKIPAAQFRDVLCKR